MAHEIERVSLAPDGHGVASSSGADSLEIRVASRTAIAIGPGWFESSWDLHRGLEVQEAWPGDHALRTWLDDFLGAQRAAGRIASPSASTAIA